MLKTSMDQIRNTAHQTLGTLIAYLISPIPFLLPPIIKIYHPNVDVMVPGITITILSTIVIANVPTKDPFVRLYQWIIWNVAWVWLLHSECRTVRLAKLSNTSLSDQLPKCCCCDAWDPSCA